MNFLYSLSPYISFSEYLWVILIILIIFSFYIVLRPKKKHMEFKERELPYHTERSFFKALRRGSIEHKYDGFLGQIRYLIRRLTNYVLQLLSYIVPFSSMKVWLQRRRGIVIGNGVHISSHVIFDEVYPEYICIEEGVSLGGRNHILTHTKPLEYHKKIFKSRVAPVIIKKNAWIAIGVTILPGVTIGEGSVVAAGSVVTNDVPKGVMVGGIPAKLLRKFKMQNDKPVAFLEEK